MDFDGTFTDMMLVGNVESAPTQSAHEKIHKRSANYTNDEDIQLCMSWENVSSDPVVSNEQPGKAYWTRITEHFHANKTFESDRNACSLEHRWGTIQRECMKFQAAFEDVERRHPSGVPYQEHLLEAQLTYAGGKKKGFPFLHCWLKVRNSPKFQSMNPKEKKASNAKKQKTSNATSSNPINVDEDEGMGSPQTPNSSQPSQGQRPIGRKRVKEQLKNKGGDDGSYKNVVQELLVEKKEERKIKDLRWQEAKTMQERRIQVEENRLKWEQEKEIMFCDVNTLAEDQKSYVLAMRAQIAAQKMAEFSQNFGGGSSGGSRHAEDDGLGGDASI